jgi:hypothetical protein
MIVVKDERARVIPVSLPADTQIAGTQVTVREICRPHFPVVFQRFPAPGTVLAMRGYDHPFLTQWMPTFFPDHSELPADSLTPG